MRLKCPSAFGHHGCSKSGEPRWGGGCGDAGQGERGYEVHPEEDRRVLLRVWGHWDLETMHTFTQEVMRNLKPLGGAPVQSRG